MNTLSLNCLLLLTAAQAHVPTHEERVRSSSLNPDHNRWRAESVRRVPVPKRAKGEPWPMACYRKDFTLPAKPRRAAITLMPSVRFRYWLYVNGEAVAEPLPCRHHGIRNLDLTEALRPGRNVLAFKGEAVGGSGLTLVAEGIVFCEDGSTVRLLTDTTWRGDYDLPGGWEQPETDASAFRKLQSLGIAGSRGHTLFQPPYYGPLQIEPVGMSQPIFDEENPIQLAVTLLNTTAPALSYEVFDELNRRTVGRGAVALSRRGQSDFSGKLQHVPLPAGAYCFRFLLRAGDEEVDRRDYEATSVGPIHQRLVEGTHYEDGMDLREVWSVDCTAEPEPGKFITWRYRHGPFNTIVKGGPAGRRRTLPENWRYASFGYRVKVQKLFVPHLVTVEWPDDAPRAFLTHLFEGTTMIPDRYPHPRGYAAGGYQRGDSAFFASEEHPVLTNRMRKLRFIYWPNETDASVHVYNAGGEAPAAASRISVYEIRNDLPALRIADAGDRFIGYHTERGPKSMSAAYYAGPLGAFFTYKFAGMDHAEFYRNWYTTTENMIKRMRFSGQNLYLMGHFMYNGVLYPSKRYLFSPNVYGAGDAARDYCGLILRMFERNGMRLVSNIEYTCTKDLLQNLPTEDEIHAGAPTWLAVSREGKVRSKGWNIWVNFLHPKVQDSMLTIVAELAELYAEYPAWQGIAILLSRWFGGPLQCCWYTAKDDPLDWGYDDYTIDLFEKDTGTRIPVARDDPGRFGKRCDWLLANARQKWIDWRCAQYTKLYCRFRDRLARARPDLKLHVLTFEPTLSYSSRPSKQALDLDGRYHDPAAVRDSLRAFGIDIDALKAEPGIVVNYAYASPGTSLTFWDKGHPYNRVAHSQQWQDLFANDGRGGAYLWTGMFHAGYKFAKGQWLFENTLSRQGYPMPRFANDTFVNVLVRSNPTWMPHTWMDVVDSGGRLHEIRQFARAYRSLPNGKYERLKGNGRDGNVWIETTRTTDGEFAYVANTQWWNIAAVELAFERGVQVHDLIRDQSVALKDGRWAFPLGPYEVQTLRIAGGPAEQRRAITAATATIPSETKGQIETAISKSVEAGEDALARAQQREAELSALPDWTRVEQLGSLLVEVKKRRAEGKLSRAYDVAVSSYALERTREYVEKKMLGAMPFIVLGPFGKPEDTAGAGKRGSNPEVVEGYRGLETPYLGEFEPGSPTLPALKPSFRPSRMKRHTVYPGRKLAWQRIVKTDCLSFYGTCHSDRPLWMVAYAYTEAFSPLEQEALTLAGSDHALAVWVNDQLVLRHGGHGTDRGGQRPSAPSQDRGRFRLHKGWNRILLKAVQRGQTRIFFRLADRNGKAIDGLRFRTP